MRRLPLLLLLPLALLQPPLLPLRPKLLPLRKLPVAPVLVLELLRNLRVLLRKEAVPPGGARGWEGDWSGLVTRQTIRMGRGRAPVKLMFGGTRKTLAGKRGRFLGARSQAVLARRLGEAGQGWWRLPRR